MEYIIVQDRQTVLLGPMPWRARFIQSEFDDLEISYQVPLADPQGYIDVIDSAGNRTGIEILPVEVSLEPHDIRLHDLVGPYYTYTNQTAHAVFLVQEKPLHEIRIKLKEVAAASRYIKEVTGTSIEVQGFTVPLDTSREGRARYDNLLNSIADRTIEYKVPGGFITIDAEIIKTMIDAVFVHVQNQFAWEQNMHAVIDAAQTFGELKELLEKTLDPPTTGIIERD